MSGEKVNSKIYFLGIICVIILVSSFVYSYKKPKKILLNNDEIRTIATSSEVHILIVGDMMLDRNVRRIIDRESFDSFFHGVRDIVKNADIAVANLEGPFTESQSLFINSKNKSLQFTFDPELAFALSDFGFDILGLANNHTLNFGKSGLETTRRYIGKAGMLYYGDPNNNDEISTIYSINGIKIGFVGFHEFSYSNFNKVLAEITRIRSEVDILIVSPHWGIEYDEKPTKLQQKLAHEFIDNGADIVIGTHSHIIGNTEEYNGKKIFYSLGNFAFDQYFSKETMQGLGVVLNVKKNSEEIKLEYDTIVFEIDGNGVRI